MFRESTLTTVACVSLFLQKFVIFFIIICELYVLVPMFPYLCDLFSFFFVNGVCRQTIKNKVNASVVVFFPWSFSSHTHKKTLKICFWDKENAHILSLRHKSK